MMDFYIITLIVVIVIIVLYLISSAGAAEGFSRVNVVPLVNVVPVNAEHCRIKPRIIYFAGPLFSIQQIAGNDRLTRAIEARSNHRYKIIEPQKLEQKHSETKNIRDQDLNAVINADGILVNFNGTDLDDGTVVEFITAKAVLKPAVVVRTDFREFAKLIPFNPLLLHYPMTEYTTIDGLELYKQYNNDAQKTTEVIADRIIEALDRVFKMPKPCDVPNQATLNNYIRKVFDIKLIS